MSSERGERVLVTGGGGYIGTHLVLGLLSEGREVCVVDDFSNAYPEMLERVARISQRKVETRRADICDLAAMDQVFADFRPDVVIHLAGLKSVPDSLAQPAAYYRTNVGGAAGLLETMERHGCRRMIFSSTAALYADAVDRANVETDPVVPVTPYARTKRVVEEMLDAWCAADPERQAISLRYFNPVGADVSGEFGEHPKTAQQNLMPVLIEAALSKRPYVEVFGAAYPTPDGSGMRDFIHVSDLADAHIAALRARPPGHRIYNVGTGKGITVLGLINCFRSSVGVDVPYRVVDARAGDLGVSIANPQRIAEELGWKSKLSLDVMCRSAWKWATTVESGEAIAS